MTWLPSIRFEQLRWWLPLSVSASAGLAESLVRAAAGDQRGARLSVDEVLRNDAPTFIWATLAWAESLRLEQSLTLDFDDLAEWFSRNCGQLLVFTDIRISNSSLSDWHVRQKDLRDQPFCSRQDWREMGLNWLQTIGPQVPEEWFNRWPKVRVDASINSVAFDSSSPNNPEPTVTVSLSLLARQLDEANRLRERFASELAAAKREALYQFAYGLSHEINNPLSNIVGRARTLLARGASNEQQRPLQAISDQAMRAYEMLADLMYIARPPAPVIEPVELMDLVDTVCAEFAPLFKSKQIDFVVERITDQLPHSKKLLISLDRLMISDAIRAVVQNAYQACERGGKVVARLQFEPNAVAINILDNGPGMSATDRQHALDPFYSGREAGRGLGLGLCKAQRIMVLHQGDLKLSSRGPGCAVSLLLPRARVIP